MRGGPLAEAGVGMPEIFKVVRLGAFLGGSQAHAVCAAEPRAAAPLAP